MDDDDLFDLLTEVESTVPIAEKAERFEAEAERLERGQYGRASLLIAAGDHWQMRGEFDKAHTAFEAARADGGEPAADPITAFLGLALERGDTEAAAQHRETLRAQATADLLTSEHFLHIGETYEASGDLREALRWYTMPFTYADPDDPDLDYFCLIARRRVRRALGHPQDRFDRRAFEELELRRANHS